MSERDVMERLAVVESTLSAQGQTLERLLSEAARDRERMQDVVLDIHKQISSMTTALEALKSIPDQVQANAKHDAEEVAHRDAKLVLQKAARENMGLLLTAMAVVPSFIGAAIAGVVMYFNGGGP